MATELSSHRLAETLDDGGAPAIVLEHVELYFSTRSRRVDVLNDISLRLNGGDLVAFVGPSGAGKTTLLHLIAGLLTPSAGRVQVGDAELGGLSASARADYRLHNVGLIYQAFHLVRNLNALQNVALPLRLAGASKHAAVEQAQALLGEVGLEHRAAHRPWELSGGEQQRVAIARALAMRPGVLLADEPTGNLDASSAETVMALLVALAGRSTVLLATHSADLAAVANHRYSVHDGSVTAIR